MKKVVTREMIEAGISMLNAASTWDETVALIYFAMRDAKKKRVITRAVIPYGQYSFIQGRDRDV